MPKLSKAVRRELGDLAVKAHRRALSDALTALGADFTRWREGDIDAFALARLVHKFHDGPARDLYNFYAQADPTLAVVRAIKDRLVEREQLSSDALAAITSTLAVLDEMTDST